MKISDARRRKLIGARAAVAALILSAGLLARPGAARADIVPPEELHPAAESYRRAAFVLNLNPVRWPLIWRDMERIAKSIAEVDAGAAGKFRAEIAAVRQETKGEPMPGSREMREKSRRAVFSAATRAVASLIVAHVQKAGSSGSRKTVKAHLRAGRQVTRAFADTLPYLDPEGWKGMQVAWLDAFSNIGTPGVMGVGARPMNIGRIRAGTVPITAYLSKYLARFEAGPARRLAPRPAASPTYVKTARIPWRLPPGANINKQLPRPRQLLGMVEAGADEGETGLIALGDMAFDSAEIFGEPARSLRITCNVCHNKGVTNPNFFIPGLSRYKGGMDVSNSFFEPHANNGIFGHLDIPDTRGIRFTAPYGRNGRTASLREFIRNVIVLEFNGREPDPMLVDGMAAYMNEFEFVPNPKLGPGGTLNKKKVSAEAIRGEEIFKRKFPQMMGGMSCASCHIPSNLFLDRRTHNIGSAKGFAPGSLDTAFDTPTLLSAKFSAPYFHDGRLPTLRSVNEWFNRKFKLGLSKKELGDLTAYVEAVSGGVQPMETTLHTLDAELEEFSFFLSTYEFLKEKGKKELIAITLKTVITELQAHKWDVQESKYMPILDKMESLLREAVELHRKGKTREVDLKIAAYRALYKKNADILK
jgi:hypothetical protein